MCKIISYVGASLSNDYVYKCAWANVKQFARQVVLLKACVKPTVPSKQVRIMWETVPSNTPYAYESRYNVDRCHRPT